MVYLAVLAVAGALMMTKLAERWDSGLAGALTVQIPPAADTAAGEATLEAVVAALAATPGVRSAEPLDRSEEHTSELQSLMRISYAVFCLKKKKKSQKQKNSTH